MAAAKRKRKSKKRRGTAMRRLLIAVLILLFIALAYCGIRGIDVFEAAQEYTGSSSAWNDVQATPAPSTAPSPSPAAPKPPTLDAYFIDVGQGDSALLISPGGKTMLIDAGDSTAYLAVRSTLKRLGIRDIDVLVATHPHSDHIGGMPGVIRAFGVKELYLPDVSSASGEYAALMSALKRKAVSVHHASAQATPTIAWDENVTVSVLSPQQGAAYENLNDHSIMLRVAFGDTSILFTGDAEGDGILSAEYAALASFNSATFRSTVLKVAHHGSSSSTSDAFLDAVRPEYAIISVGAGNDYGHPHTATLSRLKNAGVEVYRTDELGTIHVSLDGEKAALSRVVLPQRSAGEALKACWQDIKSFFARK